MTFTFRYHVLPTHLDNTRKIPAIPIVLKGPRATIATMGLIDSGADVSAIHASIAEHLGLDMEGPLEETGVVGGSVESIISEVKMNVPKENKSGYFQIPVMVVKSKREFPFLIGRDGFFERYIVTFDESKERIKLKRSS